MKFMMVIKVMGVLYQQILRDLLKKAIDNPEEEWDEWVLGLCDKIFDYKGT